MWDGLEKRQKAGVIGLAAIVLFGLGYVGSAKLRSPAEAHFFTEDGKRSEGRVAIHVAGAVDRPGLYEFPAGARVADAIKRAGGAGRDAQTGQLNLAATLIDGTQLHVPGAADVGDELRDSPYRAGAAPMADKGSAPRSSFMGSSGTGSRPAASSTASSPSGQVSINSASAAELESLPGIGPALAQRILEHRARTGGFRTVDELDDVKGIGPKTLARLRPYLRL